MYVTESLKLLIYQTEGLRLSAYITFKKLNLKLYISAI